MRSILLLTFLALLMTSSLAGFRVKQSFEDDNIFSEEGAGGSIACYKEDSEAGAWGVLICLIQNQSHTLFTILYLSDELFVPLYCLSLLLILSQAYYTFLYVN